MAFETHGILDTIEMIEKYRLDIRTVTMGISLLGCTRTTMEETCQAIYDRVTTQAEHLVEVCEGIEAELGIPIVNKRISVTPVSLVVAGVEGSPVDAAKALDKAAKKVGVNFVGGYSALVEKGATTAEKKLINSIPEALATTDVVCSSVNIASSRAGINMNAAAKMGEIIKEAAELTKDNSSIACAKLVVFANSVGDNPFM
ncbi:MAG: DUF711 family protein, partial [Corynebacterium casei]|nr:DUF711 family protein [Corynebacterium casei]